MAEIAFKELTQKMVEDYESFLGPRDERTRAALSNSMVLRAALKAGWFAEPPCRLEEIGTLNPSRVNTLARAVAKEYARVMVFDPE